MGSEWLGMARNGSEWVRNGSEWLGMGSEWLGMSSEWFGMGSEWLGMALDVRLGANLCQPCPEVEFVGGGGGGVRSFAPRGTQLASRGK